MTNPAPLPASRVRESVSFRVDGIPKGQPRPRAFSRGGHARMYDPGTAEAWKSAIAAAAEPHRPAWPFDGPLAIHLVFLLPRPKRLMRKRDDDQPIWCCAKPDADNLAKAVLDALTTIGWWRDDAQVVELHVSKRYHAKDGRPGATVTIRSALALAVVQHETTKLQEAR